VVARVFGTMASVPSGTRVEAIVLRTVGPQGSLFELLLPAGMRVLSGELAEIDVLLDDERFFTPFRPFFDPTEGRPSIPVETYLRMMFLKYRFGLGYERLCVQVNDSLSWRRFCRIGLEAVVPDESTIRKITRRCGPELVDELNTALLAAARDCGLVSLEQVRADTTVVEADVKYPTDSGLLTSAVGRIATRLRRLDAAGVKTVSVDRTAPARAYQHSIGAWLRRRSDEAKAEVLTITGLLADLAELSVTEAAQALKSKGRRRHVRRMLDDLEVLVERTNQLIAQARCRVAGAQPDGATRLVSLHEPDARPISKGRLGKPVEFGYKAQVVDNTDGIIIDHSVHIGNPSDTGLLRPAIERVATLFAVSPVLVTADRGYWDTTIETDLAVAGVTTIAIPRTGKPSKARAAIEHTDTFIAAVKWRTGCEGRISHLKRDCGWRRTRLRGHNGARTWCGHGVFAHNLVKINQLRQ
jgi:transposase, IS5 family